MNKQNAAPNYKRHRFPPAIIGHAVWSYFRFALSYRDVEELLAERGILVGCVRFQTSCWRIALFSRSVARLTRPEKEAMACPHCAVTATVELPKRTALGYRTFRCSCCRRIFNERTGTPCNQVQAPTDIVLLVVLWRLRYKRSLRDVAEMFLERGFCFTHETVRDWEARFAPLLATQLRAKRRGMAGTKWHADETYVRVNGAWCYLYRAIDREGNLVDVRLSRTRDMDAAQRCFAQALDTVGHAPAQVTTDGRDAYPALSGRPWATGPTTARAATRITASSRISGT